MSCPTVPRAIAIVLFQDRNGSAGHKFDVCVIQIIGFAPGVFSTKQKFQNALQAIFHGDAKTAAVLTGKFFDKPDQPKREIVNVLDDLEFLRLPVIAHR